MWIEKQVGGAARHTRMGGSDEVAQDNHLRATLRGVQHSKNISTSHMLRPLTVATRGATNPLTSRHGVSIIMNPAGASPIPLEITQDHAFL